MLRRRQNTINNTNFLGNRTSTFLFEPTTELDLIVRRHANINGNLTVGQDFRAKNIYASGNFYLDNYVLIPAGTIIQFAGVNEPEGWFNCNGRELLRESYIDLFNAIGTTYGSASNTVFNLPDLRGRCIIGAGNGISLSTRTIGDKGGEETHTLSISEIPSHTHTIPTLAADDGNFSNVDGQVPGADATPDSTHIPKSVPTGSNGGGNSHNNMQPYLVLSFLIKY